MLRLIAFSLHPPRAVATAPTPQSGLLRPHSTGHRPLTDIFIARCALPVGAVAISPDRHFEGIPGLRVKGVL